MTHTTTHRPAVAAVNARIRSGETVTYGEVVTAVIADTNREDLDALAASQTESTGITHRVYRSIRGILSVYPETYEQAFIDAGAALVRV